MLWSVLNPLGMMIIMSIVFSHVFRSNIVNFPVYLMCGQIMFNFIFTADKASKKPLYEQLYSYVADEIKNKNIKYNKKWASDSIKINAVKKNPIPSEKSVE